MVENIAKSYSEVDVILSKLDRRYYNKISKGFLNYININEDKEYKTYFVNNENSLIIGESLTLIPTQESSNIFNIFEKLAYNNFIKLSKYIPNKMSDSFNTYLCFTFTYLGIHLCRIMERIEKNKKEKMKNE